MVPTTGSTRSGWRSRSRANSRIKRWLKRMRDAPRRKQASEKSAGENALLPPRRTMSRTPTKAQKSAAAKNAPARQPTDSWRCPRHQQTQMLQKLDGNQKKKSLRSCVCCRSSCGNRRSKILKGVAEAFPHHRGPTCRTTLWLCHRRRHKSYLQSLMLLSSEILMLAAGRDAADETFTAGKAWQKTSQEGKTKTLPTGCGFRSP